ncbi:OLC1v1009988C1 [Oldenlandia corymbosa var. corymbosa]|uniref:OLC1v1009988C1 n=1 Tax=Oldenlandia corymbosa var. corymbosa TaxID=529605 RepID=A0AAV1DTE3_OLDCO|nr:OLC1v1009988C1 [Oldenlandia corymbosa var. corymbosa]
MGFVHLALLLSVFLIFNSPLIESQQPYIKKASTVCGTRDNSTSEMGYFCNGAAPSCQAYLTFRSLPPYNSVSSISTLLAVDPSELSKLNSVAQDAIFPTSKIVLVPVNCSCSGSYYLHNASYPVQFGDTYFKIANNTYQGLSTCQALEATTNFTRLDYGTRVNVPLRCACPTKNQTDAGVKYLLSYLVTWNDFVSSIGSIFGVGTEETLHANGLSDQDFTIYPFTTLLVPLQAIPSSSDIKDPQPPPPSDQTPPSSLAPSPNNSGSSKTWIYVVVGVLGGIALVSVSVLLVFCICFRRRKRENGSVVVSESFESVEKPLAKKKDEDLSSESFWESISSIAQSLTVYNYKELQLATDDFSPSCLLGESVYCGTMKGDLAAIKKVSGNVTEEINLLHKINHLNLIRLSGVCFHDGYWYLVFEYAEKGALSDWIYRKHAEDEKFLNWMQRIQIAFDVASGINYLHSYASPPHVHKDLKCSNVLLDAEFRAKITNFSLARATNAQGDPFALTRHIVGTKGYMAPEYLENGLVSPKLDVYSFGILLLEMLTGKEAAVNVHLSESIVPVLKERDGNQMLRDFMDASLQGDYPSKLAILVVKLIDKCLKKDPSVRPDMHEIVQTLSATIETTMSWESEHSV